MRSILYGLIVPSLLFIAGCSKQADNDPKTGSNKLSVVKNHKSTFSLTDIDDRIASITYRNKRLSILHVVQHTIIIHIFSTRAELCSVMLPYLSDLQHNHAKELFVLGIVVPEKIDSTQLRNYMTKNDTTFFISNAPDNPELASVLADTLQLGSNYPVPLSIVFHNGQYVTHYEGVTPIEMIQNDLYRIGAIERKKKR